MKRLLLITTLIFGLTTTYAYAGMGHGMMRQGGEHMGEEPPHEMAADIYRSNGEKIYYTGISKKSGAVPYRNGPMWLDMHGGSCASCHGSTGKGGTPVMMGTSIPADIRYRSLTVEEHSHGDVKEEHSRYTDELIKRAIRDGLTPAGEKLDLTMPRYQINDEDFNDLMEFLKTLK